MRKLMKEMTFATSALSIIFLLTLSINIPASALREAPEWYYDNLTPEQRLLVRKAIDYAIPRDQIIEEILDGLGTKIASPIEANDGAYDPTITAREYNLTKALDHLEEAFGYRYSESADNDEDRLGYFSMVIMAPTSRDDRMDWAALTTENLQEIGIDVTLKYANWNIMVPRVFDRPTEGTQGFDYAHGGYDAVFYGWTGSPESDVNQWFYEENFIPYGTNLGYIVDAEVEDILNRAEHSLDKQDRFDAFVEFQQWFKDNLPYYIVLQPLELWVRSPELHGVSFGFDYPNYGNWTHATDNVVTIQTPSDLKNLNPFMASSYYDKLVIKENFDTLLQRYPEDPNTYHGNLAEKWTKSNDQLTWKFKIRDGIKFSDNSSLSVDDVLFSYQKFIDPTVNAIGRTNVADYLIIDNIVKINETSIRLTLNSFYPYTEELIGTIPILSKTQMNGVPSAQWATDINTNKENAPLGSGPYMINVTHTNVTNGYVALVQNPYYNGSLRDPDGQFVNIDRIPRIHIKVITDTDSAIEALTNGTIHIIDSKMDLQPYIDEINNSSWGKLEQTLGWGHQGFYINHFNPKWGMNPGDPREMYAYQTHPYYDPFPELIPFFFGLILSLFGLVIFVILAMRMESYLWRRKERR